MLINQMQTIVRGVNMPPPIVTFLEMKVSTFNQDDYTKYDKAAKERLCSFLQAKGYKIIDKEENYGIDITCELNGKTHYFEVECKVKYPFTCQNDFKFESVSFLGRKSKYPVSFYYVSLWRFLIPSLWPRAFHHLSLLQASSMASAFRRMLSISVYQPRLNSMVAESMSRE